MELKEKLPLDDDESDRQKQAEKDDDELQEMMESLSWSQGAARSPHRKTRRRARNDRSNELEFLRNKVRQMEEELRVMHLQRLDNLVPATLPSSPAVTLDFSSQMFGFPMSSPAAPPIWDIAARHQRRSERAASENTRLHMVLDTQVSLARRLKSQLGKRIRGQLARQALPFSIFSGMTAQSRGPSFVLETETAESLRYGLNTALEELDAVFDTNGLGRLETPSTEARIREAASGMYLDIYVATLLPFDFMTTATAGSPQMLISA
ncbi:hypothetical protein PInf_010366 [Phytophthora infestans]|nr:hypothetical protein PInf_010366 [Phytophthora infestans]